MSDGNGKPGKDWSPDALGDQYDLFEDIVKALSLTMDLVEQALHAHSMRVAGIAVNIGQKIGLDHSYIRDIYYTGLLHDIGQIGTPDRILRKKGTLTLSEKAQIFGHPRVGYEIVREIPTLDGAAHLIMWHHERWDGTGYPDSLRWEGVPEGAQVLTTADTIDALLSPRPWRPALPPDEAISEMRKYAGVQFNPGYVGVLMSLIDERGVEKIDEIDSDLKKILKKETEKHPEFKRLTGGRIIGIFDLFSRIIDARHKYTRGQSRRVANLAREIGKELGFNNEDLFKIEIAGLLHQAGKVAVSSAIVDKAGKLTQDEWEIMREYPLVSERIVASIRALEGLGPVVRHQSERYDGSGYPDGLTGDLIPIFSRILAVAYTFDAMASNRAYRKALPLERIIREMQKDFSAGRLDPGLAGVEEILSRAKGGDSI